MKTIKLFNDYGSYPVWIYNEKNELIENDLPEELLKCKEAIKLRDYITDVYMKLYIDDNQEFNFIGFPSIKTKNEFIDASKKLEKLLREKVGDKYIIINELEKRCD